MPGEYLLGTNHFYGVKGEKPNELLVSNNIGDFIESTPPCKILHDWEQSSIESEYVIKNLTLENHSIVLDPTIGVGTTGLAALKLNRKFIGIEKDFETFEMARKRIKNYYLLYLHR